MKSYTPILKVDKDADYGIIYILCIENRKKTYTSLKIKINTKLWDNDKKKIKKNTVVDYISINQLIAEKLIELNKFNNLKTNNESFIDYFIEFNNLKNNFGSLFKYQNVLKKLKKYQSEITFNDIDATFIRKLQSYFEGKGKLSNNTSNHYLKLIKQVYNQAIKDDRYILTKKPPFSTITFKNTPINRHILNEEEVRKIITCKIDKTDLNYRRRSKFLFQIFAQGMRVSDLIMLKWGEIKGENFVYKMFKTDKEITFKINDLLYKILIDEAKNLYTKFDLKFVDIIKIETDLEKLIIERNAKLKNEGFESGYDLIDKNQILDESTIDCLNKIDRKYKQIIVSYQNNIDLISKHKLFKNMYIFDFLDFPITNKSNPTKEEYKNIMKESSSYSRELKLLQKATQIETNINSHLSRHTYASLLLNMGVHTYLISQALGHAQLITTEKYLHSLKTNSQIDDINDNMLSNLNFKL